VAGDKVRVTQFIENRVPNLGTFFIVYGTVLSGNYNGTAVKLNLITKEARPTGTAFVDPAYLERVN
jgi:hypothetical protein